MFIQIIQDKDTAVPKATVYCSIPRQSTYRLLKNFKNSNGGVLPGFAPKAKKQRYETKAFPTAYPFLDPVP